MSTKGVLFIGLLGLVNLGCGAAIVTPSGDSSSPEAAAPPTTSAEAYRVSIRDAPDWMQIEADELTMFGRGVVAAAVQRERSWFGLIVAEPAPGLTLPAAAALVARTIRDPNRREVNREHIEFRGGPALRLTFDATLEGQPKRVTIVVFLRHDHLYQLTVTAPIDGAAGSEAFFDQFTLLGGRPQAPPSTATPDSEGVDWRVRRGRFESLAAELSVRPNGDWSLLLGEDLRALNTEAVVGVAMGTQVHAIVLAERVPANAYGALRSQLSRTMASTLGGLSRGVYRAQFMGEALDLTVYRHDGFEYLFGTRCDVGICYQLLAWYLEGMAAEGRERIDALPRFERSTEAERQALRAALAASTTPQRSVGADHGRHGNTYIDFTRGFAVVAPTDDLWVFRDPDGSIAGVQMQSGVLGLNALVMMEPIESTTAQDEYHQAVWSGLGEQRSERGEARFGQHMGRVSSGLMPLPFGEMQARVLTSVIGSRAYRLVVWGWPEHVRAAGPSIDALMQGAAAFGQSMPTAESRPGLFMELRFGYSLQIPEAGWAHRDHTRPDVNHAMSVQQITLEDGAIVQVHAIYNRDQRAASAHLERQLRHVLSEIGGTEPRSGSGELAGIPCKIYRWRGGELPLELRTIVDGGIAYALVLIGREDTDTLVGGFGLYPSGVFGG